MVKPALAYLDVIRRAKAETGVHGRVQRLRRVRHARGGRSRMDRGPGRHARDPDGDPDAGADLILTYHAKEAADWLGWRP